MEDDAASDFSGSNPSHEQRRNTNNVQNGGWDLALQDQNTQYHKENILQELSEKQFPPEDSELILKAFEKTYIGHSRVTYYDGIRSHEVADDVVEPLVGITFMAGADTPQVNMMEQIDMTQKKPDQKDARWRVNTAGALLRNFEVDKDMSVTQTDNTPAVVANARHRRILEDGPFFERTAPSKAVTSRGRDRADRTVTIDSDNVKIVNNLNEGHWDLEATLIEVDQSSLVALMINYKTLIRHDGSAMTFTRTMELLDTMIEDARRLCIRSPILFRMSTRRHIISSKNTRYGVDHGSMFQTLTTSTGIRNIISLSAAYFNSLSSAGNTDKTQELIRPRFLQMLVLLLSLLNESDLMEIQGFLEGTYHLRADRQSIERLILKVLPLQSINSQIFMTGMIAATDDPHASIQPRDERRVWNLFIDRLLQHGYILPGTLEQLGEGNRSWVVKYPENGLKDSHIFNNLQYSLDDRTINEIPPMKLDLNTEANEEVTIILTDMGKYIAVNSDLENLIRMTPGRYPVTEVDYTQRTLDLDISEVAISEPLHRAITKMNSTLVVINGFLAAPQRKDVLTRLSSIRRQSGGARRDTTPFPEIKASGRLTYHAAQIGDKTLAETYKIDGRKITRRDLIRNLASDLRKLRSTIHNIEAAMQDFEGRRVSSDVRQNLPGLRKALVEIATWAGQADQNKSGLQGRGSQLADEPVAKVLYQSGSDRSNNKLWFKYKSWYVSAENVLYIESERRQVARVIWVSDDIIEVFFYGSPVKFFVSPLRPVPESEQWRLDELKEDDHVLLVGQYLVVVNTPDQHVRQPEEVLNFLRITGMEEQIISRRNKTREMPIVRSCFR